jgi:3'-phosphoadenosine 5'-phosphosulfate sulfotransferase (PAPS reductase)/FAD synthetase
MPDMGYIASISGGKDSAAMALHMIEKGIDFDAVFFDTGWEHPAVYEYIRGPLTEKIGPVLEFTPPLPKLTEEQNDLALKYENRLGHTSAMVRWVIKKGMFPSRLQRYCTRSLKIDALKAHLKTHSYPVNCVGVRAAESKARSKLPERELSTSLGCMVWRPLLHWSKQDVIDIHHRHSLTPNPLYLKGAERVGCWPCIYSRKSEIRLMSEEDPLRIDLIRDLEKDVQQLAAVRYAAKGETFESKGHKPPTFFMGNPKWNMPPIDEVVKWSKTSRGGQQFSMFREDELEPGCMSWGLCDTGGR